MAADNSRICNVYGLLSSEGGGIRYVGQTILPVKRRVGHHIAHALRGKTDTHRDRWIRKVIREGHQVRWVVLEIGAWNTVERKWIAKLTRDGARLVNATRGGEGMLNAPPELRARISTKLKALWSDPEYAASMKAAHAGKKWSEQRRQSCDKTDPAVRSSRAKAGRATLSQDVRTETSRNAAKALWAAKRAAGLDRGVNCNSAKLDDSKVREIKRQLALGIFHSQIAIAFAVSPGAISKIARGLTWTHVS